MDLHGATGYSISRDSASTMTQSITTSSSVSSFSMSKPVGATSVPDIGQEVRLLFT